MPKFIPGLRLSELYYKQIVEPILGSKFPRLKYSAGLLGSGSEILGYDTPQSRDHNWGLRFFLFLTDNDLRTKSTEIDRELRTNLPSSFLGYSTSFGKPDEIGVRIPNQSGSGKIEHYIICYTIKSFFREYLDINPYQKIGVPTWLTLPQQKLLSIVRGKIFHDGLGIKQIIGNFEYYPRDVWLFMLASQWSKISQKEAFVARAAVVGDELGSRIIASEIVKDLMELCFLMEKRYAPYSKWFGKAFSELEIAKELSSVLSDILDSTSIKGRERYLARAYSIAAMKHNSLKITKTKKTKVSKFYDRPYLVIHGDIFAKEIMKKIHDPSIQNLPTIGSIDQLIDSSDFLEDPQLQSKLEHIYKITKTS
ncbi:MAG TPA: DUF4037 domain-containing protein [Nitrososphaerales archaeon]|nr:DUF4037 domain-containing protein [Nitrososphaerales archaeon]